MTSPWPSRPKRSAPPPPPPVSRGRLKRRAVMCTLAAMTPLGWPLQVVALHTFGLCSGALGSGVTCTVSLVGGYFESASMWVELSAMALFLLPWAGVNLALVGFALTFAVRAWRRKDDRA